MMMRRMRGLKALSGLVALLCVASWTGAGEREEFTDEFALEDCKFSNVGRNAYFSLVPGDQLVLAGDDDGEEVVVRITALPDKKWVAFETADGETLWVKTRVIEEREWKDGELAEVSRNFFARCKQTNDVYYFGEDVDNYEDGQIVNHDGSWQAGFDEARPGLIMPGTFLLGSRYFQEIAPGEALDRAEHLEMGLELTVPAGVFEDCVEIEETTPLEPDSESTKIYCSGIGMVVDDEIELVEFDIDDEDDD